MTLSITIWGRVKRYRKIILASFLGFIFIFAGYWFNWKWTGFNASVGPQVQQYQPGRTLWDWLQLVLIPAALAFFVYWYNRRDQTAMEQRAQIESERMLDSQRQVTRQTYIDRMSDLLLNKGIDNLKKILVFLQWQGREHYQA
jgi:H+/Cl- antiporter ClcA